MAFTCCEIPINILFYVVSMIHGCFVVILVYLCTTAARWTPGRFWHGLDQRKFYVLAGAISYTARRLANFDYIRGVYLEVLTTT
jgi:hypothetical protein